MISAIVVIVVAFAFSSLALAQESATKPAQKPEAKPAMKPAEQMTYKSVTCDPTCGFMVRSHNDKELTSIVITHAKNAHDKTMTEKDVAAMAKTEGKEVDMKKEVMQEEKK